MTVQELINELEKIPEQYRSTECIVTYKKKLLEPDKYGRVIGDVNKSIKFVNVLYGVNISDTNAICTISIEEDA